MYIYPQTELCLQLEMFLPVVKVVIHQMKCGTKWKYTKKYVLYYRVVRVSIVRVVRIRTTCHVVLVQEINFMPVPYGASNTVHVRT